MSNSKETKFSIFLEAVICIAKLFIEGLVILMGILVFIYVIQMSLPKRIPTFIFLNHYI
jgi:hypothetical protein